MDVIVLARNVIIFGTHNPSSKVLENNGNTSMVLGQGATDDVEDKAAEPDGTFSIKFIKPNKMSCLNLQ